MARQRGILKLSGTLGGMTFYKLGCKYYVRRKSSLDRRRVCQDPAFARSRASSRRFGLASMLAGHIYRNLSANRKRYCTIGKLTAAAVRLLQLGYSLSVTGTLLFNRYLGVSAAEMLFRLAVPGPVFSRLQYGAVLYGYTAALHRPAVTEMTDDADTS